MTFRCNVACHTHFTLFVENSHFICIVQPRENFQVQYQNQIKKIEKIVRTSWVAVRLPCPFSPDNNASSYRETSEKKIVKKTAYIGVDDAHASNVLIIYPSALFHQHNHQQLKNTNTYFSWWIRSNIKNQCYLS